jgi:hypothetical protein
LWCYVTAAVVLIYNCCWLALAVGSEGLVGFGFGKIATLFFFLWVEDGGLGPTPFWLMVFVVWGSKVVLLLSCSCFWWLDLSGGGASAPESFLVHLFFASFGVGIVLVWVFFVSFYHKRGFGVAVLDLVVFYSSPILDGDGFELRWWWLTDLRRVLW